MAALRQQWVGRDVARVQGRDPPTLTAHWLTVHTNEKEKKTQDGETCKTDSNTLKKNSDSSEYVLINQETTKRYSFQKYSLKKIQIYSS